jgi:hypothetical protein
MSTLLDRGRGQEPPLAYRSAWSMRAERELWRHDDPARSGFPADDLDQDADDDDEPREHRAAVHDTAPDVVVERIRMRRSLEPHVFPDPPASSTLGMTVRLGAAIAAVAIAGLLVVGKLPGRNDATPAAGEAPGATATMPVARPAASATTLPQLVISAAAPGAVDAPIPLGISLVNADNVDAVVLAGLPPGSNMTTGRPSATGGWHLFAYELVDAAIRPARGFVGGADVTAELQRSDHTVVDRRMLHLEWIGAPPRTTPAAAAPPTSGTSTARLPHDEVAEDHEAIFREFLQWQASHPVRR